MEKLFIPIVIGIRVLSVMLVQVYARVSVIGLASIMWFDFCMYCWRVTVAGIVS